MTAPISWRRLATDLEVCVMFCTRLPLAPSMPVASGDIARASWAMPVAGALVGALGALAYWIAIRLGLPPPVAAALALAAGMAVTGCLHEDGLADTADGSGRRRPRAQARDHARQPARHLWRLRAGDVDPAALERAGEHRRCSRGGAGAGGGPCRGAGAVAGLHGVHSTGPERWPCGRGRRAAAPGGRRRRPARGACARPLPWSDGGRGRARPAGGGGSD